MTGWYLLAILAGLLFDLLNSEGHGYHLFSHESLHVLANVLVMLVAFAIIPEAYANGLFTKLHHWRSRGLKLAFWLIFGLAIRAGGVYLVAQRLGLENPLAVSGGLLATDPAAVGLALGLVRAVYLDAMFWQLTVESLLNDAVGISVYGIAVGQTLMQALSLILWTLLLAVQLAFVQSMARKWLRDTARHDRYELPVILIIHAFFFWIATNRGFSLILLVAVAEILADGFDERLGVSDSTPVIHHNWEKLNNALLAFMLGFAAFMLPLGEIWEDLFNGGRLILAGLALLATVGLTRIAVEAATRVMGRIFFPTEKWGDTHSWEVAPVNWLAGWTMLGVPTIVALELAAEGYDYAASAMLVAIGLSWLAIKPTVDVIKWVERRFSENGQNGKSH